MKLNCSYGSNFISVFPIRSFSNLYSYRYVANDSGIVSAILALEIMEAYIPNGTKGLNIHFLEKIAEIDQTNPKVLILLNFSLHL
jgi:hypothetical protein